MVAAQEVLHLYRMFLREGRKFNSYNIREYILRRARMGFHENKASPNADELVQQAREDLKMVQRQSLVYSLYGRGTKSILELTRSKDHGAAEDASQLA
ncbi:hypothetical protein DUNSADRAFT_520 [Dunaliella salina]|uniref:Complex 1 LYR protein domain-containing protein n=1 Tax=Dunaliella salina TaxID=3046 RepID=A0ABQ7GY83_DUNSA|nr:hypothetical protein DUNSADRAFT_520 [Dunaliella salina]|eukprot:KAF5839547.1 hypothetical protein DUNSADRAFT_520 [Dunaliella salina]